MIDPDIGQSIPPDDFSDSRFDAESAPAPTDCLIILSTPRSGSTMLCDLLYRNRLCIVHEYFQPFEYMPILAARWDCVIPNGVQTDKYISALRKYRTSSNGWLGIKIHAHHLPHFRPAEQYLEDIRMHYVYIRRRDEIAQAVSYHVASRTRQWSSYFKALRPVEYDYSAIASKLMKIQQGNAMIQSFLRTRTPVYTTIDFEELILDWKRTVCQVPGMPGMHGVAALRPPEMERLEDIRKTEWSERFARDHLAYYTKNTFIKQWNPIFQRLGDLWRRSQH